MLADSTEVEESYDQACRDSHVVECEDSKIAHLSIIDYLQLWNCEKKMERLYKV